MRRTTEYGTPGNLHPTMIAEHSLDKCDVINNYNVIGFIDIKSYNTKRIMKCEPLSEYMKILQEQASEDNKNVEIHDNVNYSMLEVLNDNKVRMYFDIENIPKDNKAMIYEIIDKIYEIMRVYPKTSCVDYPKYKNYALTFNNNSHHEGLSYHLYLPIKSTKTDIYNFIKLFNYRTDYKYANMVDYRVYGKNRLFRTVGSRCPNKLNPFIPRNQEDYHKLIKGELVDTVIQNYNDLDLVFKCSSTKRLDDEFNKRMNKMNNQFSKETKAKLIKSKIENELLLKQLDEIKDKLKDVLSNNKNKTNQLIRNQDNNRLIILMFVTIIVLMIANLFK